MPSSISEQIDAARNAYNRRVTYYPDLSACDFFPSYPAPLVAVGWLENGRPVPTGEVTEQVFERMLELFASRGGR